MHRGGDGPYEGGYAAEGSRERRARKALPDFPLALQVSAYYDARQSRAGRASE